MGVDKGEFTVDTFNGKFSGKLESYIERELYIRGEYEKRLIELFLSEFEGRPKRTILDIGANIGTHSIPFSRFFDKVISFEPNPEMIERFKKNVALNDRDNVILLEIGLGTKNAKLPFFLTAKDNMGLGTFLEDEQYDVPLVKVADLTIAVGDYMLADYPHEIDAMKIDVQGLEPDVLRGLQNTLKKYRPIVWMEIGTATSKSVKYENVQDFFPYPITVKLLESKRVGLMHRTKLLDASSLEHLSDNIIIYPQ